MPPVQHRGYVQVNAGQAMAVQNFGENRGVMAMLGVYAVQRGLDLPLVPIAVSLGVFTSTAMAAIQSHRRRCEAQRTPIPR